MQVTRSTGGKMKRLSGALVSFEKNKQPQKILKRHHLRSQRGVWEALV